ncbi:Aldose 1-epimerase family protein YeaD [Salmonella enterica subsp. enterica]|uniref:Aldose 1-epimerase family protein YeaD n=1 Tax=Salmonella enterica I TaxID=59201 RepID=A0A379WV20_SALET|nr:Aldose 1-epimerase family protein YeaD [Salmonella enterica subsp. enterica]
MINKIFALPVIEQLTPVLSRRQLDDLDLIVVDHPQVKASFALQGAHLLSWKPVGEEEVLWLSNNTPFKTGVALTRRRTDLLALVWTCGSTGSTVTRLCA